MKQHQIQKDTENKTRNAIWLMPVFIILFSISSTSALDLYHYYFEDPVVPQSQNLEVKNNLLVNSLIYFIIVKVWNRGQVFWGQDGAFLIIIFKEIPTTQLIMLLMTNISWS